MIDRAEIERLKKLVETKGRKFGEFTLASGLKTNHYFDLKEVLCDPEGITLIGRLVFRLVAEMKIKAVGGEGLGGCLIATSAVLQSWFAREPFPGFEIVKQDKGEYVIKGHFPPAGDKVALVEDTLSTGGSILRAIKVVEDRGCQVAIVVAILDRQLGGSEELRKRGYNFKSPLRADSSGEVHIN